MYMQWFKEEVDSNVVIPFLGHRLIVTHLDWYTKTVTLECKDKCCKSSKIKIRCSYRDLKNLEANLWPEIIKGEGSRDE